MKRDLLPPYEKLTKDQDRAIRYPDHTSLLVTGPPGSGKTVIALYRSKELLRHKKNVKLIVYGKVLYSYLNNSIEKLNLNIDTQTFHTWFPKFIRKTLKCNPPQIKRFDYDFNEIFRLFTDKKIPLEFDQLIIDEGQDIPRNFYRLATRMSKSITVFADENQSIFEGINSSIKQIRKTLEKFSPVEVKLTKNFRNTKRIAEFAALFKVDGIETDRTETPDEIGEFPLVCKTKSLDHILKYVSAYHERFPEKTIGVFAYYQEDVLAIYRLLREKHPKAVQYYISRKGVDTPNFSKSGIYVVTFASAKGLEFDSVFVPDLHKLIDDGSPKLHMSLYVVLTRAREHLVISYQGEKPPQILMTRLEEAENKMLVAMKDLTEPTKTKSIQNIEKKPREMSAQAPKQAVQSADSQFINVPDLYDELGEELDASSYSRARKILQSHIRNNETFSRGMLIKIAEENMIGQLRNDFLEILGRV